jgi:hypothetical protein
VDVHVLDDVREIGRMKRSQSSLGNLQLQSIRVGKGLSKGPGNKPVFECVVKKPFEEPYHASLKTEASQEPPEPDIDLDE